MIHAVSIARLADLVFPPTCGLCRRPLGEGRNVSVCIRCREAAPLINGPLCPRCGLEFTSPDTDSHLCGICLTRRWHWTLHRSCGWYDGTLKLAIHHLKFSGDHTVLPYLGDLLYQVFLRECVSVPVDMLVPIPLHRRRLRQRGFNQSLLLARLLSRRTGIPVEPRILRKTRETAPQTSLTASERRANLRGAFTVADARATASRSILVIDDVYTTGTTINECSKILLNSGASRVAALTVARTR